MTTASRCRSRRTSTGPWAFVPGPWAFVPGPWSVRNPSSGTWTDQAPRTKHQGLSLPRLYRRRRHRHVVNARLEAPALRRAHVGVFVVALVANLVRVAVETDHQHVHGAGRAFW